MANEAPLKNVTPPVVVGKSYWKTMLRMFPNLIEADMAAAVQYCILAKRVAMLQALNPAPSVTDARGAVKMNPNYKALVDAEREQLRLIASFGGTPKARDELARGKKKAQREDKPRVGLD